MTKMKKILVISLLMLGFSSIGSAQQEPQFTQHMLDKLAYNPGYAGSSGSMCAMLMYRNQWLGLKLDSPVAGIDAGSTPTNFMFSFDSPVKFLHGGIGLQFNADAIGYHKNMSGAFAYAFRMYWGPGNLAAGVEANFNSITFNSDQLVGSDDLSGSILDNNTSSSDPALNTSADADFLFDMSVGIFYQVPGTYYVGLSAKNLLASKSDNLNYQNVRSLYLMGGYDFVMPMNPSFKLKPSVLLKTANFSVFQADVGCLLDYRNTFWGGLNYRVFDAISIIAGVNWQKLKFSVAYDFTTSKLGTFKPGRSMGSLEFYLQYCFKVIIPQKPPSIYRNTRYLL